jgi:hypothetical protein
MRHHAFARSNSGIEVEEVIRRYFESVRAVPIFWITEYHHVVYLVRPV